MPDTFYDETAGVRRNAGMPSVPAHTPEPDQPSYPKTFVDPDVGAVAGRKEPVDMSDSPAQAADAQPAPEPPAEPEPEPEADAEAPGEPETDV